MGHSYGFAGKAGADDAAADAAAGSAVAVFADEPAGVVLSADMAAVVLAEEPWCDLFPPRAAANNGRDGCSAAAATAFAEPRDGLSLDVVIAEVDNIKEGVENENTSCISVCAAAVATGTTVTALGGSSW